MMIPLNSPCPRRAGWRPGSGHLRPEQGREIERISYKSSNDVANAPGVGFLSLCILPDTALEFCYLGPNAGGLLCHDESAVHECNEGQRLSELLQFLHRPCVPGWLHTSKER